MVPLIIISGIQVNIVRNSLLRGRLQMTYLVPWTCLRWTSNGVLVFFQARLILTLVIRQVIESLPSFELLLIFLASYRRNIKCTQESGKLSNYINPNDYWSNPSPFKLNIIRKNDRCNPLMQCGRKQINHDN